jgi:uncharacterized membrane protein
MERWALELIVVIISFGIFIAYHLWLFVLHDRVHPHGVHSAWAMGKKARAVACQTWTLDERDVINGIQAMRNAMAAITFMSALTGILATLIVPIMLDPTKTGRIEQLALADPILKSATGKPLVPPIAVLGCGVGVLWASFCFFAQAMRLFVHLGFLLRAVPSPLNHDRSGRRIFSELDARRVSVKAGMAFTIGLRLWYLFLPTICWAFGVTPLLIASVLVTCLVIWFDRFDVRPDRPEDELDDDECAHGALLATEEAAAGALAGGGTAMGQAMADGSAGARGPAGEASLSGGVAAAPLAAGAATRAASDVELGAPMTRLQPASALPPPRPPAAAAASPATSAGTGAAAAAPPDRAASVQLADLSRLSSEYSALSWNGCPGHSHRKQGG